MARQPLEGLGCSIFRGFTITLFLDTPHSAGLLWTRDQLVAENMIDYKAESILNKLLIGFCHELKQSKVT
jgi:hypothetical protein